MLRITNLPSREQQAAQVIKVEGRLVGEWVDELSSAVAGARVDSEPLILDMSDVIFVDHHGAELLRALQAKGIELLACSQFVSALLNREDE